MYCPKCGKEIINSAVYCHNCGFRIGDIATLQQGDESIIFSNNEFDFANLRKEFRKGISIYLNTLLQFELICKKLSEKVDAISSQIKNKEKALGWKYYPHDDLYDHSGNDGEILCHTFSDGTMFPVNQPNGGFGFHYLSDKTIRTIVYCGNPEKPYPTTPCWYVCYNLNEANNLNLFKGKLTKEVKVEGLIFSHTETIDSNSFWNITGVPDYWGIEFKGSEKYIFRNRSNAKKLWLKDFEDFKDNMEALIAMQKSEIHELENKKTDIQSELEKAKEILNKQYAMNIIPKEYRHEPKIIYSICEYFDSSCESLSFILLHLDLKKIMSQNDAILKQQQSIIINQAILNAQNKELIRQNEVILNNLLDLTKATERNVAYLAQIEDNTMKNANWASIAANNAEACAWISIALYIK